MALADTANLIVTLSLKGNYTSQIQAATKATKGLAAQLDQTQSRAYRAGQQIGNGIRNTAKLAAVGIGLLASQVLFGLKQLATLEQANIQTAAVIKSTGAVAGVSAVQVRKLAESYENLNATIDDKVIQSTENLLLTFTNIRTKAFEPALQAILDMNTALGGDENSLRNVTIQVGKALQDPATGLTALRRVGVTFSKDQEKRIKKLQEEGKLYEAQKVILQELGREFGGSFKAQGKSATATIAGIGDAVEDLQKALATALFPTISRILPKIREFLGSDSFVRGVEDIGRKIASLFSDRNIDEGAKALQGLFNVAKAAAPAIESAARVTGQVVSSAVNLFKSLPPELQTLLVSGLAINKLTGGIVTNIAGGLISSVLKQLVSGVVNVNGGVVNVNGGVGLPGASGGSGLLGAAASLAIPVTIAAISIAAAGAIGDAIDPGAAAARNDPTGAHGTVLAQRDPRRFDQNGQVIRNFIPPVVAATTAYLDRGGRFDTHGLSPGPILDRGGRFDKAVGVFASATARFSKVDLAKQVSGILTGIRARSAAKFGGSGLGESAVSATFQRKLLHTAEVTKTANLSSREKLSRLEHIQAELKAHGDTRTAAKLSGDIKRLKAELHAKDLSVTVNNTVQAKTVINGRVLWSNLTNTTRVGVQGHSAGKKP